MIVTIDGPAGAGKSTVARALAQRLGFRFLDTGAMYRAVALAGMRRGLDWDVPDDLARLARQIDLQVDGDRLLLDGEDVTEAVRTSEVTAVTRYAADNPAGPRASGAPAARHRRRRQRGHGGARSGDGGFSQRGVQDLPHCHARRARPAAAGRSPIAGGTGDVRTGSGCSGAPRSRRRQAAGWPPVGRPRTPWKSEPTVKRPTKWLTS